jgi:hypothetical protein
MALVTQVVDVKFTGGLETATDSKLTIPGKLLTLENAVFRKGTIGRRWGSIPITDIARSGSNLTEANAVARRGTELLRWSSGNVYTYSEAGWMQIGQDGDGVPLAFQRFQAVRRALPQEGFCCAHASSHYLSIYVWAENPTAFPNGIESAENYPKYEIRCTIVDTRTNTYLTDAVLIRTLYRDEQRPAMRVVANTSQFQIFCTDGPNLYSTAVNYTTPILTPPADGYSAALTWGKLRTNVTTTERTGALYPAELDAVLRAGGLTVLAYTSSSAAWSYPVGVNIGGGSAPTPTISGTSSQRFEEIKITVTSDGLGNKRFSVSYTEGGYLTNTEDILITAGVPTAITVRDDTGTYVNTGLSITFSAGAYTVFDIWTFAPSLSSGSGNDITFLSISTGAPPSSTSPGPVVISTAKNEGLTLSRLADGTRLFLVYRNATAQQGELRVFNTSYVQQGSTHVMGSLAGFTLHRVAMVEGPTGTMTALLEPNEASEIQRVQFTSSGIVEWASGLDMIEWVPWLRLGGDGFSFEGRQYVPAIFLDTYGTTSRGDGVQPTYFLLEVSTGRVVLRALAALSGGLTGPGLPRPMLTSSGEVQLAAPERGRLAFASSGGTAFDATALGISQLTLEADVEPCQLARLEVDSVLHIGGACPLLWDGSSLTEDGFHWFPEGLTTSTSGSSGLPAGTYQYRALYEWTDAQGRLHRSAPSPAVSVTLASAKMVTVNVPMPLMTRRGLTRIIVYRTVANGTVFYRVSSPTAPVTCKAWSYIPDNPPGGAQQWAGFYDTLSDADLTAGEALYTTGRILDYLPPPAYRAIHRHSSYLFVTRMEDARGYAHSLPIVSGLGTAWSDQLVYGLEEVKGELQAFSSLDGRLILFTDEAAAVITGEGPAANGLDNGFSKPNAITGALGCTDWRAVVSMPDGIMYGSSSGIYLLTRALESAYIGSGVDLYKSLTITQAVSLADPYQEVRFYTEEGRTLVYSWRWSQWSTFTLQPTQDLTVWNGRPVRADGEELFQESEAVRKEGGSISDFTQGVSVPVKVGTGWLVFDKIQGIQRIRRFLLLGTVDGDTEIQTEVFIDYDDTSAAETKTYDHSGNGAGTVLSVRAHLANQKCTALRLLWTFTPQGLLGDPDADLGDIALTALTFEVGILPGVARKLPASRTM